MNGSNALQGRLEVCVNKVWGTVCSRGFGIADAKVVCRKLGFASDDGSFDNINSDFSPGVDPTFLELVRCKGNEMDLLSCPRDQPLGLASCPHSEDVGLVCPDKDECANSPCTSAGAMCINTVGSYMCTCGPGYTGNGESCSDIDECELLDHRCIGSCENRIGNFSCTCMTSDESPFPGVGCRATDECSQGTYTCKDELKEVCNNTVDGFECVCGKGLNRINKSHICMDEDECMQSFPCGSSGLCRNAYSGFTCHCQPGFVQRGSSCECEDQQIRLVDGVISQNSTMVSLLKISGGDTMFCQYRITAANETDVFEETCGGSWSGMLEGRVEVCMNNEYQSVCDDRWDALEARVVCNQLRHLSKDVVAVRKSGFGFGSTEFILDDLDCRGSEDSLFDCQKNTRRTSRCSLDESAGVRCGAVCEDFEARILVGSGESYYGGIASARDIDYINDALSVGRVEVCFGGSWRALCSSHWTRQDASVVCQQLGFAPAGAINGKEDYRDSMSMGELPINLQMRCTGNESRLRNCPGAKMAETGSSCQLFDNAYVICQEPSTVRNCTNGEAHLVDGPNVREGRLEICINEAWGTVCSTGFFDVDAEVACAQMKFVRKDALYLGTAGAGAQDVASPIFLRDLRCTGSEDSLLDCNASPIGTRIEMCSHESDVRIKCKAFCPAMTTFSSFGSYSWNRTMPESATSAMCKYTVSSGGSISRACDERGNWQEIDYSYCTTKSQSILTSIRNTSVINTTNVGQIVAMLRTALLINTTEDDQTSSNKADIERILGKIANCSNCINRNRATDLLAVLSSVSRWTAAPLNSSANISVSMNIDQIITNLSPAPKLNETLTVNSPGITYTRLKINAATYASTGLMYRALDNSSGLTGGSVSSPVDDQGGSSLSSIMLPSELFRNLSNKELDIVFGVYETASLFPRSPVGSLQNGSLQIASSIVSTTVIGNSISNLKEHVIINMTLESEAYRAPVCMFWDAIIGDWSNEGCANVTKEDFVGRSVTCRCNHLTTFAVMVNVLPENCSEGFSPNFEATSCDAIKPDVTVAAEVIQIGSGQKLDVECTSSGPFPGRAVWRKVMDEGRVNVTEISITNTVLFNFTNYTFSSDLNENELGLLGNETLGQLYAYRFNDTRVLLGSRRADVFGAAIGIGQIANGMYECFAENVNTSNSKILHLNITGRASSTSTTYVRFSTQSIRTIAKTYVFSPNSTQSSEFVFGMIGTAVLVSSTDTTTTDTTTVSISCTSANRGTREVMNDWTRINCMMTSNDFASIVLNKSELQKNIPTLPIGSSFIEEQGVVQSDNGFCDYDITVDNWGQYYWNETEAGQTVELQCFYEPLVEGGFAFRTCGSHQRWDPYNVSLCVTENTFRLRQLSRLTVTADNAVSVVANVSNLLLDFNVTEQREDNFMLIAEIYTDIGQLIGEDEFNATTNLTSDTVNVLNSVSVWPPDSVREQSSNLISSFEVITGNLVIQEGFTGNVFQEKELGVIADLTQNILPGNPSISTVPNDKDENYVHFDRPNNTMAQLNERSTPSTVAIPGSIFLGSTSLVYSLYESGNLFQVVPPFNETEIEVEVDTMVVGFTLFDENRNRNISSLTDPVILTFRSFRAQKGMNFSDPLCVSWDLEAIELENKTYRGNWTTSGCTLNIRRSNVINGVFVCECTHLTNFAVMVNINSNPPDSLVLTVLTIIGSVLSIVGLAVTIFLLLFFKNIRIKVITKFHVQLCLALLLMYLVFVIGIMRVENEVVCTAMSVLIQYTALTSVFWMCAEAVLMLKTLVLDVFHKPSLRFVIVASIISWVVPAVFPLLNIIISLATKKNYMITKRNDTSLHYCFMSDIRTHIPLFLLPIYSMIIFNAIAFLLIIRVLILQKRRRARKSMEEAELSSYIKTIASIISIMSVYGIFWLIGVLNIGTAAVYFQWPFLVLNVFQGVIIFLLVGVFNTYKEWKNLILSLSKKKREIKTACSSNAQFHVKDSKREGIKETNFSTAHTALDSGDFDSSSCKDVAESSESIVIVVGSPEHNDSSLVVCNLHNDDLEIELKPEASLCSDNKTEFD